jgi:hypothetical protein
MIHPVQKCESPGGAGPFADQTKSASVDSATVRASAKEFATLQAAFALRGHELVRIDPTDARTGYYCSRWGLVRHLPDVNAVRAFLAQIGGVA